MKSIQNYLDAIAGEKNRLVKALNENSIFSSQTEPLGNIVTKSINAFEPITEPAGSIDPAKIVASADRTYFVSAKTSINFTVTGTGDFFVNVGEQVYSLELENNEQKTLTITNSSGTPQTYYLSCAEISCLDLRDNAITDFYLGRDDKIVKLVLCNNNISSFLPTNNKQIQFLHIFNNPICDNQSHESNLKELLLSLPNRSAKSIGSIVMHPWPSRGLEILICHDDNDAIVKYPKSYQQPNFKLEEDKLYGLVEKNNKGQEYITYCYWNGTELDFNSSEIIALNRYHSLRKNWELEFSLAKNWMFGSAILYNKDEKDFHYHLRKVGVADVWDTAEKGFGMCFGVIDVNCGWIKDWHNMNIEGYYGYFSSYQNDDESTYSNVLYLGPDGYKKYDDGVIESVQENREPMKLEEFLIYMAKNPDTKIHHGDFVLSYIVGRGDGVPYGACPNAKILPVLYKKPNGGTNFLDLANFISVISLKCNTITCSFGNSISSYGDSFSSARNELGSFGLTNVVTVSGSNSGTGQEWEYTKSYYDRIFGDFEVDGIAYHSSAYYCGSLDPNKVPSGVNHNATGLYDKDYSKFQNLKRDYLVGYGPTVGCKTGMDANTGETFAVSYFANGTSYSTPNCCATLGLMRIIYSKMHPEETNFGKDSSFMKYVRSRWIDPINYHMTFAVGMGLPSFLNETFYQTNLEEIQDGFSQRITAQIGQELAFRNTSNHSQKDGYCLELDSAVLARTKENTYYLLDSPEESMKGYSLFATPNKIISDNEVTAYNEISLSIQVSDNSKKPTILDNKVPFTKKTYEHLREDDTIYDDGFYTPIFTNISGENFTIQLVLDFSKILLNTNLITNSTTSTGLVDILTFPQEAQEAIALRLIGLKYDSTTGKFDINDAIVPATDKTDCSRFNYSAPSTLSYSVFGPPTRRFAIKNNTKGVLTVTHNKEAIVVYYNGTLVFEQPLWLATVNLSEIGYNPNCLADIDENILIYNKELTQREVISNTVAILNTLREES